MTANLHPAYPSQAIMVYKIPYSNAVVKDAGKTSLSEIQIHGMPNETIGTFYSQHLL